ncbi:MAG: hypothetical protein RJB66_275 [Pseudomonadota bacterium]|jgi:hypothetical protein
MIKSSFIVLGLLLGLSLVTVGCAPINQENIYGNGFVPATNDSSYSSNNPDPDGITDYASYQVNFVTISVNQVLYRTTDMLSYITLRGSCFNPGFQTQSIFYRALDREGYAMASDGYPYSTNQSYIPGTSNLRAVPLKCRENGSWETIIELPTATLMALDHGTLEVSLVVWYNNQELHNQNTGVTSVEIMPPQPQPQLQ